MRLEEMTPAMAESHREALVESARLRALTAESRRRGYVMFVRSDGTSYPIALTGLTIFAEQAAA